MHFLLRKEQEIVLAMYNQLNAYLQLYKNRMAGYGAFNQKYKIEAALAKMQPILLNLNVY